MGERADQIEQQIYQTRNELSENFNELEEKVKNAFDWRTQFEERPITMMAVAFGGGVLLSALLPSRRPRRNPRSVTAQATGTGPRGITRPAQGSDNMDALKGALVGVAANRLGGILGDLVSGYRRELQRTKQRNGGAAYDATRSSYDSSAL
jgi:hypothetical protein